MIHAMLPLANIESVFPLFGMLIVVMIPIVAILTRHQQRMAELMNQNALPLTGNDEMSQLRNEVKNLREVVTSLAITVDNMNDRMAKSDVQERMKVID